LESLRGTASATPSADAPTSTRGAIAARASAGLRGKGLLQVASPPPARARMGRGTHLQRPLRVVMVMGIMRTLTARRGVLKGGLLSAAITASVTASVRYAPRASSRVASACRSSPAVASCPFSKPSSTSAWTRRRRPGGRRAWGWTTPPPTPRAPPPSPRAMPPLPTVTAPQSRSESTADLSAVVAGISSALAKIQITPARFCDLTCTRSYAGGPSTRARSSASALLASFPELVQPKSSQGLPPGIHGASAKQGP